MFDLLFDLKIVSLYKVSQHLPAPEMSQAD